MISAEKSEHKDGYLERINSLTSLKDQWKIVKEAYSKEGKWKDLEEFIKSTNPKDYLNKKTSS